MVLNDNMKSHILVEFDKLAALFLEYENDVKVKPTKIISFTQIAKKKSHVL